MTNNQSRFIDKIKNIKKKKFNKYFNNIENNIPSFRMQEEFGPKKRIKPGRTSTRSQQQIPPRGHKKGFRGKTISLK